MRESQGAKCLCRTLRSLVIAGCDVWVSHPAKFFELFSAKPNLMVKSTPMSWECLEWAGSPPEKGHWHGPKINRLRQALGETLCA